MKVTNCYYCQNKDIYKVLTIEIFAARQSHFLQKLNSVLIWIFGVNNSLEQNYFGAYKMSMNYIAINSKYKKENENLHVSSML